MKKIKIVSIWNPKGGQGKSLLSVNLAAAAVEMGIKPLVICQDPQGTSMNYYRGGNLNFEVVSEPPQERPDADIIFFDHQASDWEVPNTHLILMPLKPARDQYATYIDAYKRASDLGRQIITVVTDGKDHRASEKSTSDFLIGQGAFVIPASGVFSRAAEEYRTIFDPDMSKAYKIKERRQDVMRILGALLLEENKESVKEEEKELVYV